MEALICQQGSWEVHLGRGRQRPRQTGTADTWDQWQRFTVTGVAAGEAVISHTISGNDPTYTGGVIVGSVAVTVEAPEAE